jgi:hypothetical protein
VPYARYGETVEGVAEAMAALPGDVTREALQDLLPARAPRATPPTARSGTGRPSGRAAGLGPAGASRAGAGGDGLHPVARGARGHGGAGPRERPPAAPQDQARHARTTCPGSRRCGGARPARGSSWTPTRAGRRRSTPTSPPTSSASASRWSSNPSPPGRTRRSPTWPAPPRLRRRELPRPRLATCAPGPLRHGQRQAR